MANVLPNSQQTAAEDDYVEPTNDRAATFLTFFFPMIVFCLFIGFIVMITLVAGAK